MSKVNGYFAAVFDGHGGWQVSNKASTRLHTIFENELSKINEPSKAINSAYDIFESELKSEAKTAFELGFPKAGYVGACALSAFV
jgi:serine/threonine protein phosphatase PrpC